MPHGTALSQRAASKPQAGLMSRDGDRSDYVPILANVPSDYDLGDGDTTDEEDWASLGPTAVRLGHDIYEHD